MTKKKNIKSEMNRFYIFLYIYIIYILYRIIFKMVTPRLSAIAPETIVADVAAKQNWKNQ